MDLGAVGDLIGFGIVFPGSKDTAGAYYSIEIEGPSAEELDEIEAEEEEAREAAGVA